MSYEQIRRIQLELRRIQQEVYETAPGVSARLGSIIAELAWKAKQAEALNEGSR